VQENDHTTFLATGAIANPSLNAAILNGIGFVELLNSQ
jgi:hypothetical protein